MAKIRVWEFDRCEAATAGGHRCQKAGQEYVHNPGAPFGFLVCGTHYNSAQRLLERVGEIPRTWGKHNFSTRIW